jgi:hypothetical protein
MFKRQSLLALLSLLLATVSFAQVQYPPQRDQFIQARISGSGGGGKCTFEVVIDGAADVEIRGSEGRLRWVGGGGLSWRRLDCNQPLPRNPNNFRFKGIDGRGSQTLLRSPNGNNGVAVIRLDDPQKGSEGYTGDIMWDGGSDYAGGYDRDHDRDHWNEGDRHSDSDDWHGNGDWGPRVVSNCQSAIRNQMGTQFVGSVNFNQNPNLQRSGRLVTVQGFASYRDRKGRTSDVQYNCTMTPSGGVTQASYNPVGNRWPR